MLAFITIFLLFAAFLLLLLVSLSVPIIHPIYLFKLALDISHDNDSADGSILFGLWGYCFTNVRASIASLHDSQSGSTCTPRHLGYTLPSSILDFLNINSSHTSNIISKAITAALVIHPIAAGLTFLALLFAIFIPCRGIVSRTFSGITMFISLIAALLSTIVFIIDIVFVALTRNRIRDATNGDISLSWGNAVWMTLGAAVALWAATVGACCGICACGGRRRERAKY